MNSYLSRYLFYYPTTYLRGEKVYPYLKESRAFQYRDPQSIESYQLNRIQKIFKWAKEHSVFYQKLYQEIDMDDLKSLKDVSRLPLVSKQDLINHANEMQTNHAEKFEFKTTGGSTGEPVKVAKNMSALARERAGTWRCYEWAGVKVGDPQGRFWGVPHTKKSQIVALLTDFVANRKRVSAFNMNDESLFQYYNQLKRFSPKYLYGYVSAIETLAMFIKKRNLSPLKSVKSIITTSEVLHPPVREFIQDAFKVKVFNEYGCGEVGSIAHQCELGKMHIMADNMLVTIVEQELVVTDFYNYKMPLINYRTGDFGEISDRSCCCGRNLPILDNLYGRAYDIIRLRNGKSIHPEAIIYVFEDFKADHDVISQFQAVQQNFDFIELFVVALSGWQDKHCEQLIAKMKTNIDPNINFKLTVVEQIQREKSGKMRVVKSLVKVP